MMPADSGFAQASNKAGVRRRLFVLGLPMLALGAKAADAADAPRVLALGGAVTETTFALGAGDLLAGVDLTSRYPAGADRLPKVGYVRALGAEGMLSLNPNLVLASADAGPPEALARVAEAGVEVVRLPEAHTPEGALTRVLTIGRTLRREQRTAVVADDLQADLTQIRAELARASTRPRVLFLLSAGRGAPMGAGRDTAADAMINLAGGINVMHETRLYRPLSTEAVLLAEPEIILTTSDTLAGAGGLEGLRTLPGLRDTPAMQARQVYAFDALYMLGFGPRLAHALRDVALALRPQERLRPLPPRDWTAG